MTNQHFRMPVWRNWLARQTFNLNVASSSLAMGGFLLLGEVLCLASFLHVLQLYSFWRSQFLGAKVFQLRCAVVSRLSVLVCDLSGVGNLFIKGFDPKRA